MHRSVREVSPSPVGRQFYCRAPKKRLSVRLRVFAHGLFFVRSRMIKLFTEMLLVVIHHVNAPWRSVPWPAWLYPKG
jgi:hypothetical protein